jgi:hypothetical protein
MEKLEKASWASRSVQTQGPELVRTTGSESSDMCELVRDHKRELVRELVRREDESADMGELVRARAALQDDEMQSTPVVDDEKGRNQIKRQAPEYLQSTHTCGQSCGRLPCGSCYDTVEAQVRKWGL